MTASNSQIRQQTLQLLEHETAQTESAFYNTPQDIVLKIDMACNWHRSSLYRRGFKRSTCRALWRVPIIWACPPRMCRREVALHAQHMHHQQRATSASWGVALCQQAADYESPHVLKHKREERNNQPCRHTENIAAEMLP